MVNKFIIFCESNSDPGNTVRYVNDIFCNSEQLQEILVHLNHLGVHVFKVLPILIDEYNGLINLEHSV